MRKAIQRLSSVACCCAVLVALPFLGADRCVGDETAGPGAGDSDTCELTIGGKRIEKLILVDKGGSLRKFRRPNETVSLSPGEYRVEEVGLEGGFTHHAGGREAWFSLEPERPHRLAVGAPLEPQLELTRRGKIVRLSHQLLDAGGRDYQFRGPGTPPNPPQVTVSRAGRRIGSGSFEYG